MQPSDDSIVWDVVEEHLDEAGFAFEMFEAALGSQLYDLDELIDGPQERLEAHLDGLCVGGSSVAEALVRPAIDDPESDDPPRVAAAALALLGPIDAAWSQGLLAAFAALGPVERGAVARAMELSDRPDLDSQLRLVWETATTDARAALLPVFTARRLHPGRALDDLLRHDDIDTRAAALLAAPFGDRQRYLGWVEQATGDADETVAKAATRSGLALGSRNAWAAVAACARDPELAGREVLTWAAQFGEQQAVAVLAKRLDADAIWALGFSGRPEAADLCTEQLDDEENGPLAADAFAAITGLPREGAEFWVEAGPPTQEEIDAEAKAELPPLDEDLDETFELDPEDELAVPNPDGIRNWWQTNRQRFDPKQRFILGLPATSTSLVAALRSEPLRRRHALAFELYVRSKGQADVHTRRFGTLQRRQLDALGSLPLLDANRPFSRL